MTAMQAGARASAELVATEADMASALALSVEDDFPEVFATSRMVALMELAAARCMKPLLRPGQLSVGVNVDVAHLAATPKGVTVRAEATFTGMQGKLYCFELNAWDKGGLIGRGSHTRAIVASERLLTGARTRNESTG
jgi:predicted thioesterase